MVHDSGVRRVAAASSEAVQYVWRPNTVAEVQPVHWCADSEVNAWASSDANKAWRTRRAKQQAREAVAALVEDVGEAESHSLVACMVPGNPYRRNYVRVDGPVRAKTDRVDGLINALSLNFARVGLPIPNMAIRADRHPSHPA